MATALSDRYRNIDPANVADFDIGAAHIRPAILEIRCDGKTKIVERRVMQMLVALDRAGGTPISRDELVELCWGGLAVSDDAITQCVSKLRRALAFVPAVQILSVPRIGYRLVFEDERASASRTFTRWPRRIAATAMLIAAISPIGFLSDSVATIGSSMAPASARSAARPNKQEADRLHAAAVQIFRERSRPGYTEAEKLLGRAVAIDPQNAPSWARLAMAVYGPYWWKEKEDAEARARLRSEAIGYARRALSIDPNLAEAHQAMGFILRHDGGERWFERAAALDPNNPEIRVDLANMLENGLELRRANAELIRAIQLEPTSQETVFAASLMLDRLGHRTEADALVDNFEQVTHRTADARRFRFELQFQRGELAKAAASAAQSLDTGDEDQWWRQFRLFDIATALRDNELRTRVLNIQPKLAAIDYDQAGYSVTLARTRPNDWWANPVIGGLARQLVMTGNERLLVELYDNRYHDVSELWKEHGDWADCLAPPLILAMRRSGRAAESVELRNHFFADIEKLESEGDSTIYLLVWRAELAALDGNADLAARRLDAAVTAGWKGQAPYRVGFDPDRDPVFALVRGDPRVQREIARFHVSAATEVSAINRLRLLAQPWARTGRERRST